MENFLVVITTTRTNPKPTYLQGPRTPKQVKRDGYGFTQDPSSAWPFKTQRAAAAKAKIVDRHMGWEQSKLSVQPPPST
jgi:hypothetical protein